MGKQKTVRRPATVRAAGGVVWRDGSDGREVLVVHRPRYGDWSLPKGKLSAGEPAPLAAVREVLEETGLRVRLGPETRTVTYRVDGVPKEVRYWIAEPLGRPKFRPNREVDKIEWLDLEEAKLRLRDADLAIAHAVLKSAKPSRPLVIVRHALSTPRKEWPGSDRDRPLSRDGRRQATQLAPLLACWAPTRLVTSPALRCVDTIAPLAEQLGLTLELEPALSEEEYEATPKRGRAVLRDLREAHEPVVVCMHRPLLPMAAAMIGLDLPKSALPNPLPKSALWVAHANPQARVERYSI